MTTGEKIKLLRKDAGLTQTELGEKLGVQKNAVSKWECGRVDDIPSSKIKAMAKLFGVRPSYLIDEDSDCIPNTSVQTVDNVIDVTEIRFLGEVAAGYGLLANEEYEYLKVPTDWLRGRPASDYFAMRVKGSSMYPEYRDGDEVLCLSCSTMERSGQTGVIVYGDGEATLKKLEYVYGEDWLKLVPVNPEYETKIIRGEELEHCRVIGRAIKLIRDC